MNPSGPRQWLDIALFLLAGFIAIGLAIIPMGLAANSVAFPDVLFALFVAWVIRQPDSAPVVAIVFLSVLADALMMRPIGLWAMMLLVGTEGLRLSERAFRDIPFLLEWLYVSVLFVLLSFLQNVVLFVSFSEMYAIGDVFWHAVRSIAVYPVVVAVLHWGLRIRATKKDNRPNRLGFVL